MSRAALQAAAMRRRYMETRDQLRPIVFERDGYRCRYCGTQDTGDRATHLTLDHVHSIVSGGSNELRNLVTCCHACNNRKGRDFWEPRPLPQGSDG